MNEGPTYVVSGAAGFIGRRVTRRLAGAGVRVAAVDRAPKPAGFPEEVEYRCGDVGEIAEWAEDFVLVHLAWNMNRADEEAQAASVREFRRLLGAGRLRGVVGMGSAEEYGERGGGLREDMAPGERLSAYGRAKSEACRELETWAGETGRRGIWLRPFVVYGPGQGGNMAIPYAVRCAREGIPAEFSEGLQRRDFIHVDDVAEGIVRAALDLPSMREPFSVFNLGRGEPVRLRDVLERIAERTGARDLFQYGKREMRANEPREQVAEVSSAEQCLGWRAEIPWPQGIDALCAEEGLR